MRVLCTICARSGSKGLKNKNIKKINGKNLICFTIEQAIKSKIFDNIVISTDSEKIQKITKKYQNKIGCWFLRSKSLSTDKAPKIPVIKDALKRSEEYFKKKFDYVIDLDPTSPLRLVKDIKIAFKLFKQKKADLLITGCESRKNPYFNMFEIKNKKAKIVKKHKNTSFFNRQSSPKVYEMNASIYIWKRKSLITARKLFLNNTIAYIMPYERSIDIDSELDFQFVKKLIK